jgi:hypothetical protein
MNAFSTSEYHDGMTSWSNEIRAERQRKIIRLMDEARWAKLHEDWLREQRYDRHQAIIDALLPR